MPSLWTVDYETASGDTTSSTQTLLPLNWTSATITLRRRAPHTFAFVVPRSSHHRLSDFTAGRELRVSRNGAYIAWGAGFMDAPSLPGGSPATSLLLPGWGCAYILTTRRAYNENSYTGVLYSTGFDADSIIGAQLDDVRHAADDSSGTAWFTSGGRTLGTAATSMVGYPSMGKSPIEVINDACDVEGWAWRAGINTSGTLTFKASGTVETDLSATVQCFDGANCQIADFRQDASNITTFAVAACRNPALITRLNGAHGSGGSALTVDSNAGFEAGDLITVGEETGVAEFHIINTLGGSTTINTIGTLANAHSDNETVKPTPNLFRTSDSTAAAAQRQAHHFQAAVLFNDSLQAATVRAAYVAAYVAAYDAPQRTATIETTDLALIDRMLDNSLEPGDSIQLTSQDQDLSGIYSATTVKVQEMTLEITPGAVVRARLLVGDPVIDGLAVLERKLAAARLAATSYKRGT